MDLLTGRGGLAITMVTQYDIQRVKNIEAEISKSVDWKTGSRASFRGGGGGGGNHWKLFAPPWEFQPFKIEYCSLYARPPKYLPTCFCRPLHGDFPK